MSKVAKRPIKFFENVNYFSIISWHDILDIPQYR